MLIPSFAARLSAGVVCATFATATYAQAATVVHSTHALGAAAPATPSTTITAAQRATLLEAPIPSASPTLARKALAKYTIVHDFAGPEGANPQGALLQGLSSSLYGATIDGGASFDGTIFKSGNTANAAATALHAFTGTPDGATPMGGLRNIVGDTALVGYLYGVSTAGGKNGMGAIYDTDANGNEKVVYSFTGGTDGAAPMGRLLFFIDGNYYGTTSSGGNASGFGTVFKFNPLSNKLTTIHTFQGTDGANPTSGLAVDVDGFALSGCVFGVTSNGGSQLGGTAFAISPSGTFGTIYNFGASNDSSGPSSELTPDLSGNLYGTANGGPNGGGTVFKLTPSGTEKIVHAFTSDQMTSDPSGVDPGGNSPEAPVSINYLTGTIYGTTNNGGNPGSPTNAPDAGVVFRLDPSKAAPGNYAVLHTFVGSTSGGADDGTNPESKLIVSFDGNLYGATNGGGVDGDGTLFALPIQ